MKLSDQTIAHIAKIIQVAILTGTDLVDNLRLIDLKEDNEGHLNLEDAYAERYVGRNCCRAREEYCRSLKQGNVFN